MIEPRNWIMLYKLKARTRLAFLIAPWLKPKPPKGDPVVYTTSSGQGVTVVYKQK